MAASAKGPSAKATSDSDVAKATAPAKKTAAKKTAAKKTAAKKTAAKKTAAKRTAAKKTAAGSTTLGALPASVSCETTAKAQRFLDAGVATVTSALSALDTVRDQRRTASGKLPAGRLTDGEEDLLRAVVVFASAGLDSVLKQLIRDALGPIAEINSDAQTRFHDFAVDYLAEGDLGVSPKRLVQILLDDNHPWDLLLEAYIRRLTGDSLQSADQVGNVCSAIGFLDKDFRTRIKKGSTLDLMFRARNQMIHELDLAHDQATGPGLRPKRSRTIPQTVTWATETLAVAQEVINAAGNELNVQV